MGNGSSSNTGNNNNINDDGNDVFSDLSQESTGASAKGGLPGSIVFSPGSNASVASRASVASVASRIEDLLSVSKQQLDILYLQDVLPIHEINVIVNSLTSKSERIIDSGISDLQEQIGESQSVESQESIESIESIKKEIEILNNLKQDINVYLNRFLQSTISFPLEYLDMSAAITNPEGEPETQNLFSTLKTLCVLLKQCPFEFEINGIQFSYLATLYWELLLMVVTSSGSPEKMVKRILRLDFIEILLRCKEICQLYELFDKACNGIQDNEFAGFFFVGGDLVVGIGLILQNAYEYMISDFTSELTDFFKDIGQYKFNGNINNFNQFMLKIGVFVRDNFVNEDGTFNYMFNTIITSRSDIDTTCVMKKILEGMRCSEEFEQEFKDKYPPGFFDDEEKRKFLYYIEKLKLLLTTPNSFKGDASFFLERIKVIISALRDGSKTLEQVNHMLEELFRTAKTNYSGATEYAQKKNPNIKFFPQAIIISDVPKEDYIAYPIALDMSLKKEMIATGTKAISTAIIDGLSDNKKFPIDNLIQFVSLILSILNRNISIKFQLPDGMSSEEYNRTTIRKIFSDKEQMLTHLVPVISNSVIQIIEKTKDKIQKIQKIFTPDFMEKNGYIFKPTNDAISFYFVPTSVSSLQEKQTDFSGKIKRDLLQFGNVKNVGVTANFCEFSGSISDIDDSTNIKKVLSEQEDQIHRDLISRQEQAAIAILRQQQYEQQLAAQKIQSRFRGTKGRQDVAALRQQQAALQQQQQAKQFVAQKIQSRFRGNKDRQDVAALREQQAQEYRYQFRKRKNDFEGGSKTRKNKKSVKKFIKTRRKNKKSIKKNTKKKQKNNKNIRKSRK